MSSSDHYSLAGQVSHDDRRSTRRRVLIIAVSMAALVAIVTVGAVFAARKAGRDGDSADNGAAAANIKAVCTAAEDPGSCYRTLSALSRGERVTVSDLYRLSVQLSMSELSNATLLFEKLRGSGALDAFLAGAADGCKELLEMAVESLNATLSTRELNASAIEDFRTWLSAALTYQDTCLEGFQNASRPLLLEAKRILQNSTEFSSNSLAIMTFLSNTLGSVGLHRKLLQIDDGGFPLWVSAADRRLLQASADPRTAATVVVAQDGSGKFRSINAALKSLPLNGGRTIVYVKKGVYKENVRVEKKMTNVMIVGDGMDDTVITGSLNAVDGVQTFKTATLAVFGKGFIGRGFAVQNTAGAAKHQAVALMSDSDLSVYYLMKIDGFQDTLYTHTMRQFYRQCNIYGTVDFIFGNAAVVLQSCNIFPRVPMSGQFITLTAQGRTDKNQNTGTSVHSCTVAPFGNLAGVRVFLGRPWKAYSRTVVMKTSLPAVLDPRGWAPWGSSAPSTIFYAEYLNAGPGAGTAGRVKWAGVRTALDAQTAASFTVDKFIGGGGWLPGTAVPYVGGL